MAGETRSQQSMAERLVAVEAEVKNLCQRFDSFEGRMDKFIEELRTDLKEVIRLYNNQQPLCAARGIITTQLTDQAKDLETRMKRLEELYPAIKTIIWIGAVIGVSIIALIWALITGQAQLIIK
jgi:chromosome segregation ATPase